jgi:hypothetical protein
MNIVPITTIGICAGQQEVQDKVSYSSALQQDGVTCSTALLFTAPFDLLNAPDTMVQQTRDWRSLPPSLLPGSHCWRVPHAIGYTLLTKCDPRTYRCSVHPRTVFVETVGE